MPSPGRRLVILFAAVSCLALLSGCAEETEVFGAELYQEACATCHEREGYSLGPGSAAVARSDADLENAIRYGRTGMPAFDTSFTEEQVQSLVDHLRRLQAGN